RPRARPADGDRAFARSGGGDGAPDRPAGSGLRRGAGARTLARADGGALPRTDKMTHDEELARAFDGQAERFSRAPLPNDPTAIANLLQFAALNPDSRVLAA